MPHPTTASAPAPCNETLAGLVSGIAAVVLGKDDVIRLALACVLARGHLLIEDQPGMGKTTLAHALARALGLEFQRIQFTSDLLPSDIIGVSIYEPGEARFRFHRGPVFSQLVLADEINRATPKAQSALLEAMEERQVTVEGETHRLPEPFFVIATQNPARQTGTFELPESQLDRFLVRVRMGYPGHEAERALLIGTDRRELLERMRPFVGPREIIALQRQVVAVHASDALIDYVQALLRFSREDTAFRQGLSPRAGRGLLRCAQAWALIDGRNHVLPEDVQAVLPAVAEHRLLAEDEHGRNGEAALARLLAVSIP
ncbi:MAG: MoxR family ATPase [Gammaproteobacteria bacterium]|jgi:MoxR-like ATPase|nr:MoxR family ATPase [Gammaproteobacteria bacterium]